MRTMNSVNKFFPSEAELAAEIQKDLPCSISGCGKVFTNPSALHMHMVKTHKVFQDEKDSSFFYKHKSAGGKCHFHCPVSSCKYCKGSERHFSSFKLLREHYLRIHGEKKYKCAKCGFAFGMERNLKRHESHCGIMFKCGTCECPYTTKEALMTHCYRKDHHYPEEYQNKRPPLKSRVTPNESQSTISTSTLTMNTSLEHVTPDVTTPLTSSDAISKGQTSSGTSQAPINVFLVNVNLCDKTTCKTLGTFGSSSDSRESIKILPKPSVSNVRENISVELTNSSTQISHCDTSNQSTGPQASRQTSDSITDRTTTETQTTGDYILQRAMQTASLPVQKESRGAQVSPRAKLKCSKRPIPMQTTSVQTSTPKTAKRRKRKKTAKENEATGSYGVNLTSQNQDTNPLEVQDLFDLGFSDNETQTIALIEELEASLAASISTQTRESYLADSTGLGLTGNNEMNMSTCMHTIETQTLSFDLEENTANNGFGLLNFFNSSNPCGSSNCGTETPSPSLSTFGTGMSSSLTHFVQGSGLYADSSTSTGETLLNTSLASSGKQCKWSAPGVPFRESTTLDHSILPADQATTSPVLSSSEKHNALPVADILQSGTPLFSVEAQNSKSSVSTTSHTQTVDTMFDQLLSNMETQTSDDLPFPELGFMDSETQTPFDLGLGSSMNVETQTSLQVSMQTPTNVQSTDTETQTLFRELDLTDSHTQTSLADLQKLIGL